MGREFHQRVKSPVALSNPDFNSERMSRREAMGKFICNFLGRLVRITM